MATITKGTYVFNDKPTIASGLITSRFEFNFNCDNVAYNYFFANTSPLGWQSAGIEYGEPDISVYSGKNGWADEKYKTIDIPNDTSVDDTFYTWFTANTTKQESAAKMYIGTNAVNKMYLGSKEVKKAYLGDKLVYEQKSSGETWVLNSALTMTSTSFNYKINFTSNGQNYDSFIRYYDNLDDADYLRYSLNNNAIYAYNHTWQNQAYRTITFATAPTGDLLTWLQANGTKQ